MLDLMTIATSLHECAHVAVPEASQEALRYYQSGNILWIIQQAWSLIVPLLFLFSGFSSSLEKCAQKYGRKWFFALVCYLIMFIALYQLLNLPLDYYATYLRPHAYGLSTQTLARWIGNFGKSTLVTTILSASFVWIFYLLLKKSPKRWWIYSSFVTIGIAFLMMWVQPLWIDPLFHHFGPMKNRQLEKQILDLAARAGIENGRVFEVDMSMDTNMLNAYVIGMGGSKRIVLWDTTIAQMPTDQILFVMGHEMGHYVLHHLWWEMGIVAAFSFVIFYLTYRSAHFLTRRYNKRFGFKQLDSFASLPLLLLLTSFFMLLFTPASNYVSRYFEHEADRFGLEITQNNKAAAEAFITLQKENLANPRPGNLYTMWRSSHPSLGDRIDFCNSYCPWKQERPLKYSDRFH